MTRILALDTAMGACSAAVVAEDTVLAHCHRRLVRGHAEALMPMIERVRQAAGMTYESLDAFAVTIGPGTFTGLRIGLAAARAMALATGRPLIGIGTLEALAEGARSAETIDAGASLVAAIDARRGEAYIQAFTAELEPLTDPAVVAIGDVSKRLPKGRVHLVGSAGPAVAQALADDEGRAVTLSGADVDPDAVLVARRALGRWIAGDFGGEVRPLYLRRPDARLPRSRR